RRATVPAVIAEVKRSSPSAGWIDADADPASLARAYEAGGAAAISVLTEPRHFGGSLADLRLVRATAGIPVLRKDFLIDPNQLVEARAAGADSVLLIAACLDDGLLDRMLTAARAYGTAALAEHFRTFDTICSATQDRQDAVLKLIAEPLDLMVVIGGYNSSNTTHLAAICQQKVPTYHVEDAACIDAEGGTIRFRPVDAQQEQRRSG